MSKLHIASIIHENGNDFIADVMPSKIWVCHCEQCRYVKNKRKNRKLNKKVKNVEFFIKYGKRLANYGNEGGTKMGPIYKLRAKKS